MAVKCLRITENKPVLHRAVAEFFADSKSDVTPNMEIKDFPPNYIIEMGSTVITGDFQIAVMKSDGTWSWKEEES